MFKILLIAAFALCVSANLSIGQIKYATEKINSIRSSVHPQAAHMKKVKYSKALASVAQKVADACKLHNIDSEKYQVSGLRAWFTGSKKPLAAAFDKWSKAKLTFDYKKGFCSNEHGCENYLRLINENITRFGCGVNDCSHGSKTYKFVICEFDAPFHRGAKPYAEGPSCSGCKTPNFRCEKHLCAAKEFASHKNKWD